MAQARARQVARFERLGLEGVTSNAGCPSSALDEIARPDAAGLALLRSAAEAMRLTARGYHRVLKVARTLADLDGDEKVGRIHLAEALSYRSRIDQAAQAA